MWENQQSAGGLLWETFVKQYNTELHSQIPPKLPAKNAVRITPLILVGGIKKKLEVASDLMINLWIKDIKWSFHKPR